MDPTMNPTTVIETAVKVILGEQYERAPCIDDQYFIGTTILEISGLLRRYGRPTIEMLNMSIEIGKLTPEDCHASHITLISPEQGRRDADPLRFIADDLYITDPDNAEHPKPSEFGRTYDFDVCQACPAFITAICTVHDAGFTADSVHERAKAYWLATFGFWG
jgi:hypothetical protein